MLDFMRRWARAWFIKVALGLIIVSFVGFYGWSILGDSSERGPGVARVNDVVISTADYARAYQLLEEQYRRMYGGRLPEAVLENLDLPREALERLIERHLLLQEAARMGFRVSPDDLARSIQSIPAFQRQGRFSPEQYLQVLRANRLTPAEFETAQQHELLVRKLQAYVLSGVTVTDTEIADVYRRQAAKVSVRYLRVDPVTFRGRVTVTPEALRTYFQANAEAFRIPARVKAEYIIVEPAQVARDLSIPADRVQEYFEEHKEEYGTPPEVRARHILIKARPDAPEAERARAKARAEEIARQAKAGGDFAALARKHSEDAASAARGGDLGFFSRGQMVEDFATAAFALTEGEVSDVVATSFGFHVIKVEARRGGTAVLDEARRKEIEGRLRDRLARERAEDVADEIRTAITKGQALAEAAGARGVRVVRTDFFSARERLKEMESDAFYEKVLAARPGDTVVVDRGDGAQVVATVTERTESRLPTMREVEEKVRETYTRRESERLARAHAESLLAALKAGKEMAALTGPDAVSGQTPLVSRQEIEVPGVGRSSAFVEGAFTVGRRRPFPDAPVTVDGRYYVLAFKERVEAPEQDLQKVKEQVRRVLLQAKTEETLRAWLDDLKRQARIERHLEQLPRSPRRTG